MNLNFVKTVVHLKSTEASFTLLVTFLMQKTYPARVCQALLGTSGSSILWPCCFEELCCKYLNGYAYEALSDN